AVESDIALPIHARTKADFSREAFAGVLDGCARNRGLRPVQPLVAEVGYAIGSAAPALPGALIIKGQTPACHQTVVAVRRDDSASRVDKTIKPDIRIDHLELRCNAEILIDRQPLADLHAECFSLATIIIGKNAEK